VNAIVDAELKVCVLDPNLTRLPPLENTPPKAYVEVLSPPSIVSS
jgi:hypothetical protein